MTGVVMLINSPSWPHIGYIRIRSPIMNSDYLCSGVHCYQTNCGKEKAESKSEPLNTIPTADTVLGLELRVWNSSPRIQG